jgi:hypothetical protein
VNIHPEDVLPPEGTLFFGKVWNNIIVIFSPNQHGPLNIGFLIEFFQMLQQQGIILHSQIDDSQTPLSLGFLTKSQAARLYPLFLNSSSSKDNSFYVYQLFQ